MSTVLTTIGDREKALVLAPTSNFDLAWSDANGSRGHWILDVVSTDRAALPPEKLHELVSALVRPKKVDLLVDGTVRVVPEDAVSCAATETTIRTTLNSQPGYRERFRFSKSTSHTPAKLALDAARDGTPRQVGIKELPFVALPPGIWTVAIEDGDRVVLTRQRT